MGDHNPPPTPTPHTWKKIRNKKHLKLKSKILCTLTFMSGLKFSRNSWSWNINEKHNTKICNKLKDSTELLLNCEHQFSINEGTSVSTWDHTQRTSVSTWDHTQTHSTHAHTNIHTKHNQLTQKSRSSRTTTKSRSSTQKTHTPN